MEKECSKCHRSFIATKEEAEVCPDCLKGEFATLAPKLDAQERAELHASYQESIRRQAARAETLGGVYASGRAFNIAGKLRLSLGLAIFLVCGFLFLISDKESNATFLAELDTDSQRMISMILCVVSAVLVATSTVRYRKTVWIATIIIASLGWFFPDILREAQKMRASATPAVSELQTTGPEQSEQAEPQSERAVLSEEDLQVFYDLRSSSQRVSNYAVFMDHQDSRARSMVRDALNRLMEAEYTRAYTRANGALYVIANAPGERRNISRLLSRFGHVVHADAAGGIYEVRFDVDKVSLVSQYSPDVLSSPLHTSYVTGNLSELRCLDPMRVRQSAQSLTRSNVRVLRSEIRDVLVSVLQDPWSTEPDTYAALIDALVTYSRPDDKEAVRHVLKYFEARRSLNRDVSPEVTMFLIREVPEAMVNPILDLWSENPIAWDEMLNLLGARVQQPLLERLEGAGNIRLITTILKYLEDRGTPEALPVVERFLDYPDTIIRHSARTTVNAIKTR